MSFSRFAIVALIAGASAFAINANAASASAADQNAAQSASATAAAPAASKAASHRAAREARAARIAKIDLNSADEAALAKIRSIGAKKATIIIAYRTKNGPFSSVEDLKNVTNAQGKPLFTARSIRALDRRLEVANAATSGASAAAASQTSTQ